jgi:Cd2+/Zn2+-exporting ATPase
MGNLRLMTDDPETAPGREVRLRVPSMDCASCARTVQGALGALEGVSSVKTMPASGRAVVTVAPGVEVASIVATAQEAGYEVTGVDDPDGTTPDAGRGWAPTPGGAPSTADADVVRPPAWRSTRAKRTAVGALFLAAGLVVEFGLGLEEPLATVGPVAVLLADLLFLAAVATAGVEILRGGLGSARSLSLDIDFLMSAAIASAVLASLASTASLYSEAATLAVLFGVAELLERHAMDEARGSLRALIDQSPDEATLLAEGEERTVPVDALAVGDRVAVRPGERVPVDGVVREGASAIDESPVTGESVPADKAPGEDVYAGTINEEGYLVVEATAEPGQDTLSRVIRLVEDAEANRTEREQFVDRFAGYYTPVMVALAVAVATVPPLLLGAPWLTWFVAGITMLVLACPCAFVISTPVTVVSGITSAARNGVLVKGGNHLETMGAVDAVAFDKTGTLTTGELAVTDVVPVGDRDEDDVLQCARGLEARSSHPLAEAIVAHAEDAAVPAREVEAFESLTGRGVEATLDGRPHYAGKPGLFGDLGFDLEHVHVLGVEGGVAAEVRDVCDREGCLNLLEDTIPRLQGEGKTVVLVGRADELEGVIAVADRVRPESARIIERLHERGLETVMLTGDNAGTTRAVAEQVGVGAYRADLLPEAKVEAVEALGEEDQTVAMVGDGVNDAPALATASVGVAMGAAGTDAALETADVALLGDDLTRLPYLVDLAARANEVIRQNIWASLGVKALLAVGVPLGVVRVAIAVLVGDAGMTIGVTGNAMRLSRIDPEEMSGRSSEA